MDVARDKYSCAILFQSRSARSTRSKEPSPGSGVPFSFGGEVVVMRGVPGPALGDPKVIGVAVPLGASLGGTGILRSSGEGGIISGGKPGIGILVASLL